MATGFEAQLDVDSEEGLPEDATAFLEDDEVLVSFIAPYVAEKKSPSKFSVASVTPFENMGMVRALDEINDIESKTHCHFLINSPGGGHQSSFQVARCLRSKFDQITAYVPQSALSGGTIITLAADEVVMGPSSILGPIDPVIQFDGESISALKVDQAFESLQEQFQEEQLKEIEVPFPYDTASQNLTMERVRDARGKLTTMVKIAQDLLSKGMLADKSEDQVVETASSLVYSFPDHSYPITRETAEQIGLEVRYSEEMTDVWKFMKEWLELYVADASDKHIIRYHSVSGEDQSEELLGATE